MIDRRLTEDCLMELTLLTPVCLLCCEADPALMLIMLASLCWSCRFVLLRRDRCWRYCMSTMLCMLLMMFRMCLVILCCSIEMRLLRVETRLGGFDRQ